MIRVSESLALIAVAITAFEKPMNEAPAPVFIVDANPGSDERHELIKRSDVRVERKPRTAAVSRGNDVTRVADVVEVSFEKAQAPRNVFSGKGLVVAGRSFAERTAYKRGGCS